MRPLILIPLAALLVAGCSGKAEDTASSDTPSASASPSSSPSPSGSPSAPASPTASPPSNPAPPFQSVTVVKTGGFAGVNETIKVTSSGAVNGTKKLTATDLNQLRALVAAPAFAAEAKRSPHAGPDCRDGFEYRVTSGPIQASGTDCGNLAKDAPTMWKIVQLIEAAAAR